MHPEQLYCYQHSDQSAQTALNIDLHVVDGAHALEGV
jgi:hypothetical protein